MLTPDYETYSISFTQSVIDVDYISFCLSLLFSCLLDYCIQEKSPFRESNVTAILRSLKLIIMVTEQLINSDAVVYGHKMVN